MAEIEVSERVRLRSLAAGDAEPLSALVAGDRERLARWLPWAAGQTLEQTREFIAEAVAQEARGDGFQAVLLHEGEVAGVAGYHRIDQLNRATSIGYWLAAAHEGHGLMTAAVRALVDHAFGPLGLNRVTIEAAVENRRSRAIPERLGFSEEGVLRESERIGERYLDGVLYSVLASEWPPASTG